MQVYTSFPQSYLYLAPVGLFCLAAGFSAGHCIGLLVLTAIFCVGAYEECYYNMAISVVLVVICMGCNLEQTSRCVVVHISPKVLGSVGETVRDPRIWALVVEGVALSVVLVESLKKYHKFRNEAL